MRLAKSDEIFADPASLARCETMALYLLTMDRNEVTGGLAKNSTRFAYLLTRLDNKWVVVLYRGSDTESFYFAR
jgi:hypothetical protein